MPECLAIEVGILFDYIPDVFGYMKNEGCEDMCDLIEEYAEVEWMKLQAELPVQEPEKGKVS